MKLKVPEANIIVNIQTVKHSKVLESSSSEQEIDFTMCHMSTSWSGDMVSCQ